MMNLVERLMDVVRRLDWSDQKEPILEAINRIEELEKENLRLGCEVASRNKRALDGDKHVAAAINAVMKIEELESKLKIAVEALEKALNWAGAGNVSLFSKYSIIVDTLRESIASVKEKA